MQQPVYWTMRNGQKISVDDMDEQHLRNTLKMILRNLERIEREQRMPKNRFQLKGDMAEQFNSSYEEDCPDYLDPMGL